MESRQGAKNKQKNWYMAHCIFVMVKKFKPLFYQVWMCQYKNQSFQLLSEEESAVFGRCCGL